MRWYEARAIIIKSDARGDQMAGTTTPPRVAALKAEEDLACVVRDSDLDTTLAVSGDRLLDTQFTHWNSTAFSAYLNVNGLRRQHIATCLQTLSVRQDKECRQRRL